MRATNCSLEKRRALISDLWQSYSPQTEQHLLLRSKRQRAEKELRRISLKVLAVFGSCKIKTAFSEVKCFCSVQTEHPAPLLPWPAMPWGDVGSPAASRRNNCPAQYLKSPETKWKPLVGQQAARRMSRHRQGKPKEGKSLSPSAFSAPAVTGHSSVPASVQIHRFWAEPVCSNVVRTGMENWTVAGLRAEMQLAGWKECSCIMNMFAATLHSLILQYQQRAGSLLHRDSHALRAGYLQEAKWLKLSIAKPLYCKNWDRKKSRKQESRRKDCTAAKTMSKYEPPKIYYNQSKKNTKQNTPMEMMSQL